MKKYMASCSCGKDSVAMIEMIIDAGMKLDEIVFAKVEKSFPQELEFMNILITHWESKSIKCTMLETETTWDKWFYGKVTRGNSEGKKRGFPLTAFPCWWSREAKFKILDKYMKDNYRYIGIAFDEPKRYHEEKEKDGYLYPLVTEFRMTERQCRAFCKKKGLLNPLYKYFDRLGCFLCPKQNKKSLKNLYKYFPEQWEELKFYVKETNNNEFVSKDCFKPNFGYEQLLEIEQEVIEDSNQLSMF